MDGRERGGGGRRGGNLGQWWRAENRRLRLGWRPTDIKGATTTSVVPESLNAS